MHNPLPVSYLAECSDISLRHFVLARLNIASNLRKELALLLEELVDELVQGELAAWLVENRTRFSRIDALQERFDFEARPLVEREAQLGTAQRL